MPVADFTCPNCGAAVDFAGGTRATCSFCHSQLYMTEAGVKAASVLNDLLENQPAQPLAIDFERVQQLIHDGQKIQAIKLIRSQTNLGLKEAKDAAEAIERGERPELTPRTPAAHGVTGVDVDQITELLLQDKKLDAIKLYRQQTGTSLQEAKAAIEAIEQTGQPPQTSLLPPATTHLASRTPRHVGLGGLLGCLPILIFIGLCGGFIMLSSHVMFRAFGPMDQALKIVNSDPSVVRALGEPITPGAFVTGEIESSGNSSSAQLSVPIYGPHQSGEMSVSGEWRRGVWDLDIWVTFTNNDGEEQTISISRRVK